MKLQKRPELLLGAVALIVAAGVLCIAAFTSAHSNAAGGNPFEAAMAMVLPAAESEPDAGKTQAAQAAAGGSGDSEALTPPETSETPLLPADPFETAAQAAGEASLFEAALSSAAQTAPPVTAAPQTVAAPQTQPQTVPTTTIAQPVYPVNINTATQEQLETLPGIGPVKAQSILSWRAANGSFTDPAQLLEISGIGEKTLGNLLPYLAF